MTNTLFGDKDYQLWFLLNQARDSVFKVRQRELSEYGISPEEARVMFIVHVLNNNCTPAEIAKWRLRRHHTVLSILNRMEQKKLISKTKDLERKNLVKVSLTDKGQQAFYQSTKIDLLHQVMSSLSQEERQQLRSFLETLRDRALEVVNNISEPDPKPPFP
jgi:DNA-binding MarR family transcriptional regulator